MPVARATIWAMSSAATSGARCRFFCRVVEHAAPRVDLILDLAGAVVVLRRGRLVALAREPA